MADSAQPRRAPFRASAREGCTRALRALPVRSPRGAAAAASADAGASRGAARPWIMRPCLRSPSAARAGSRYDAIVVGAGHNGLVTACYLARARACACSCWSGGTSWAAPASPRRPSPASRCRPPPTSTSLFRKEIVRDLRLGDYGFEVLARNPSSFTPYPDGRSLLLGPGRRRSTAREIAKFSARDAVRYPEYEAMLERVAAFVEPTLDHDAARPAAPGPARTCWQLLALGRAFARLGPAAPRRSRCSPGRRAPCSTAGSSRWSSRRRWPPTPSSAPWRAPRCPARPTCSSTT